MTKPPGLEENSALFALILTIILFMFVCCCYYGVNTIEERFFEKKIKIDKVFDDEKDLIIIEEKPTPINVLDRLVGKHNNSKINFRIEKDANAYRLNIPAYEDYSFGGKGLVIAANGLKYRYVSGVYMNVYVIRKLYNSDIPIEIFYVGVDEQFNNDVKNKLIALGNVKLIDLMDRLNTNVDPKRLIGYRTKPLAVIASSFKEVVLMDADALSFIDPFYFFELEGYKTKGMVLFKDYVECLRFINKKFINDIGIGYKTYCNRTGGYELDSSCVVVDKERAWEALYTICMINVESDSYYNTQTQNVLGDKDTWLIGSMFVNFDPYISEADPGLMLFPDPPTMKIVWGHLQSLKIEGQSGNIPLYYNNQAIDLSVFDGMKNWGYIEGGIKNPQMLQTWTEPYIGITPNMIKSFETASVGLKSILPVMGLKAPVSNGMVVKNLIQ